jgi:hypothetical protein
MSVICGSGLEGIKKKNARIKQVIKRAKWAKYDPLVASGISKTYSG